MALTSEEEAVLKKLAAEKIKQDAIVAINDKANADVQVHQEAIAAIQSKRNTDIASLEG